MEKKPLPPGFQSRKIQPLDLPNPASFRQLRPAILGDPPVSIKSPLFERRRVVLGIFVVVALHASLGLAWWLMPPLRLKVGIDPKRWVQVVSVPEPAPAPAAHPLPTHSNAVPLPLMRLPEIPAPEIPVPSMTEPAAPSDPRQ
jgi:hypothetical protein